MNRLIIPLALTLQLPLLFSSCEKETEETPANEMATIHGVVTTPSGMAVNHALVYTDVAAQRYSTYSAENGSFSLECPAGSHTLVIQTGDGDLFQTTLVVDVTEGQTLEVPVAQAMLRTRGDLAYIAGAFDAIEAVVRDTLGYPIREITDSNLLDLNYMRQFIAIFINCGSHDFGDTLAAAGYNNLAQFVYEGGDLYVSDWGLDYFIGTNGNYYVNCNPPGGFLDDSLICVTNNTIEMDLFGVGIVDTSFQQYMGTTTMDAHFDLPSWYQVISYDQAFWNVIVVDATYGPLLMSSDYLSQHGNGTIYFSALHNEYNATTGNQMQKLLKYVILTL